MTATGPNGSWEPTTLSEIARVVRGRVSPQEHPELPFIGMDGVEAHTMRLLGTVPAASMKSAAVHFRPGDVLYGRLRPYLNKVISPEFEGLASAEFIPLTMAAGVSNKFVQYRINSSDFVAYASRHDEGDRPRVDYDQIAAFPLHLPPSGEQQRIVEAIESYFTRLDDAMATLERVQRNLERYRASVLKSAVEGRLVPTEAELSRAERRDYEPASDLLERILAKRRQQWEEAEVARMTAKRKVSGGDAWRSKYQEPAPVDPSTLPSLPDGWCWVRAEQVCDFITKGTTPKAESMSQGAGDIPYVKVYNLTFDGTLDFSVDPTFVDLGTHRELLSRSVVLPGDVLTNIVGPPLGKVSIVPSIYPEWNINQAIARFRPRDGLFAAYVAMVLSSTPFVEWTKRLSKATAGQFNLTLQICRDAPIPLAPLEEQRRIIAEFARITSLTAIVVRSCERNLAECSKLRQSILKWAFEGRLVGQDPSDEPASALLERICDERKSSNGTSPNVRGRREARARNL